MFNDTHFLSRRSFISLSLFLLPRFQYTSSGTKFLSFDAIEPLLAGNSFALPKELTGSRDQIRAAWPQWIQSHDRQIRSRLLRGEEDTLVNFVLFGVSFTDSPRVSLQNGPVEATARLIDLRIQHFISALAKPGLDRLVLLNNLVTRLGYKTTDGVERERLRQYVLAQVGRYISEREQYQAAVARSRGNDVSSASPMTQLYKDRGLSLDTDFRPNYAIEQTLTEVKRRGLLRSVKRAAIIGPGLDFTDKDSGFDYYPLQTLQPFALVDSLLRLDMARISDLKVTIFDISTQTLDHVSQAITRARSNQPYPLQLVLDRSPKWNAGALSYWRRLGDRIGSTATPMPVPPQIRNVDRRAIRIRPEIVSRFDPQSLNIISQHEDAPSGQRFDLIVATNIFLYYDRFEQALALLNMQAMLNPGGVVLSNDLVADYAGLKLRGIGSVSVQYTPTEADQVRMYSTPTFQPQSPPA